VAKGQSWYACFLFILFIQAHEQLSVDDFQLITWSKDRTLRFWPIGMEVMQVCAIICIFIFCFLAHYFIERRPRPRTCSWPFQTSSNGTRVPRHVPKPPRARRQRQLPCTLSAHRHPEYSRRSQSAAFDALRTSREQIQLPRRPLLRQRKDAHLDKPEDVVSIRSALYRRDDEQGWAWGEEHCARSVSVVGQCEGW
jgi:hypothetical protein